MNIRKIFSKEKELRMIWKIEKDGKASYMAGTSHFFPYSFKDSLRRHISKLDTVLLEGPVDEASMIRVIDTGKKGEGFPSLYDSLDNDTINKIIKEIGHRSYDLSSFGRYQDLFITKEVTHRDPLKIKGLRPWMAFFKIWYSYLEKNGWGYTMDVDALNAAEELGKEVHFLEKIEEQIEALNGIPVERIANFLKMIGKWDRYTRRYIKYYIRGDHEGLISGAKDFPTYCESIIDKRDPILYERMKPFLEKGNTFAIVGVTHIKGIRERLLTDGFTMQKL